MRLLIVYLCIFAGFGTICRSSQPVPYRQRPYWPSDYLSQNDYLINDYLGEEHAQIGNSLKINTVSYNLYFILDIQSVQQFISFANSILHMLHMLTIFV